MRREVNCLWRLRNYSVRTCATSARQSIRVYWKGNRIYSVLRHDRKKTWFAVRTVYLKASFGRNGHLQSMWNIFELAWQTKIQSEIMPVSTDYGYAMAKSPILCGSNSNPHINIWDLDLFCKDNGWLLENMDKGLTVPKVVLKNQQKICQMSQNLSVQAQKFGISMKEGFIGWP